MGKTHFTDGLNYKLLCRIFLIYENRLTRKSIFCELFLPKTGVTKKSHFHRKFHITAE